MERHGTSWNVMEEGRGRRRRRCRTTTPRPYAERTNATYTLRSAYLNVECMVSFVSLLRFVRLPLADTLASERSNERTNAPPNAPPRGVGRSSLRSVATKKKKKPRFRSRGPSLGAASLLCFAALKRPSLAIDPPSY